VAWSLDNEEIIHVRDVLKNQDLLTYTGHASNPPSGYGMVEIAFAPDGERVASLKLTSDIRIRVWSATTGTTLCSIDYGDADGLLWSPDGKRILAWGFDDSMHIWDAQTGAALTTYSQNISLAPAWSPNSQYIASNDKQANVINIWNAETGQLICTYQGHQTYQKINLIRWSPNNAMIASVSDGDNRIHVWNAATGKLISMHDDYQYTQVTWSPDSKHIASKGPLDLQYHSFQVWDVSSGTNTINYGMTTMFAEIIKWSPDGRLIAATDLGTNGNSVIHIWRVGWGHTK
jgi:WD40 repeat protein